MGDTPTEKRKIIDDGRRDWNDAATGKVMAAALEAGKGKERLGAWAGADQGDLRELGVGPLQGLGAWTGAELGSGGS